MSGPSPTCIKAMKVKGVRGLTLVEILLAIAIMGIVLVIITLGTSGLFKLLHVSENALTMSSMTQSTIEVVRSQWRTHSYRSDIPAHKQDNQEIERLNFLSLDLYDRNCLAMSLAQKVPLERLVAEGHVTVMALDRMSRPLKALPVVVKATVEDCLNMPLPDGAPRYVLKRIRVHVPASYQEISAAPPIDSSAGGELEDERRLSVDVLRPIPSSQTKE